MASLYRTQRDRFVMYPSDGLGRDKYIKFNNGGFWKGKETEISMKPSYPNYNTYAYYSLNRQAAPFRYYSDGSGRDSYILDHDGGLIKSFSPMSKFHLKDFLRKPESCIYQFHNNTNKKGKTLLFSQDSLKMNHHLRYIQKGIIKRLYTQEKYKFSPKQSPAKTKNEFHKTKTDFPRYETECHYKEPLKTITDFEKLKTRLKKVHRYELNCKMEGNDDSKSNKSQSIEMHNNKNH